MLGSCPVLLPVFQEHMRQSIGRVVDRELQDVMHVKDGEVRARMVSALVSVGMPSQIIQAT